jgi:hypothetical protein
VRANTTTTPTKSATQISSSAAASAATPVGSQFLNNPETSSMFRGTAIHNATADILRQDNAARFIYNPSYGPDITDTITGQQIEISTEAQAAMKALKYPWAHIVGYGWSPW